MNACSAISNGSRVRRHADKVLTGMRPGSRSEATSAGWGETQPRREVERPGP